MNILRGCDNDLGRSGQCGSVFSFMDHDNRRKITVLLANVRSDSV